MKQLFKYIVVLLMLFVSTMVSAQSTIKVMTITNGTVTADKNSASKGDVVTITVTPSDGYYFLKENLKVVKTVDPNVARTRVAIPVEETITIYGDDPDDLGAKRSYTFVIPEDGFEYQVTASFTECTEITDDMVSLSTTDYTYNGYEHKPSVYVNGLTQDMDYLVSFTETSWINAGTYSVNVSGIGKYKGTVIKEYTIAPKTVSNPTITLSETNYIYDGNAKEPTVTVKDGTAIIPTSEYTVSYSNNIEIGTATVIISDKDGGNYTVSGSTNFIILADDLSIVDVDNPVTVDGQTLYEPSENVEEAIKETIESDIALPIEAENRMEVTDDGGLKFSKGGNMQIGLLDLKLTNIVKFVFTGKLYGDNSKLRKRNASSSRGTRTAGNLEIISGVEYEVIEAGDQIITVALEEAETTIETIIVTEAEPDQPVIESESIKISDAKQVPYCSQYDLDFTNLPNLKAYVATGYDKATGTIWLTRAKLIPANTGFLLIGDPGDYEIPVSESASNTFYKNMFKGTLEEIVIQTTDGKYTNYYLSKGTSGVGFYKVTNSTGQKIGANRCYLPILTDIPANGSNGDSEVIKVSAAKQVPYYTSKNIDFSSLESKGVKAYTATGYNYKTGIIWLTRVKKVPAKTGILVMADKEGEYSVPTTSVQSVYENMFTGSETSQTIYTTEEVDGITYINYYLSNGASGIGFYKVTNENGVKMGANRSYLQIPKRDSAAGTRGMYGHASFSKMVISDNDDDVIAIPVFGGDATGIISTQFQNAEQDVYYNLQGQRVDRPSKGVFIRNGRKVVMK